MSSDKKKVTKKKIVSKKKLAAKKKTIKKKVAAKKKPAAKKSAKKKKTEVYPDPLKMSWQEISKHVPKRNHTGFCHMVMQADMGGTLAPIAKQYPDNPLTILVKEYLKTKKPSLIKKAVYAVVGTEQNAYLYLMKL